MNLKDIMPTCADVPKHEERKFAFSPANRAWMRGPKGLVARLGGWQVQAWWTLVRRMKMSTGPMMVARVYLNGAGTDHELRFVVWRHDVRDLPCQTCDGSGRVFRPQSQVSSFLAALGPIDPVAHDKADLDGKRSCMTCLGSGRVKPMLGAANDFAYLTQDIVEHFAQVREENRGLNSRGCLGERGLQQPTKEDVLYVMNWCDRQIETVYKEQK